MNASQKTAHSPVRRRPMDWAPTDDPARLDQIVRIALDDPSDAAMHLAHWIDCRTTHHEGSDAARAIYNWAYDPSRDSPDSFAWYVRKSRDALPVRLAMRAILAGAAWP
jgi:hypothetical protein